MAPQSQKVPIAMGIMLHIFYHLVDLMFVGRLGASALAAITYTAPLWLMIVFTSTGLGVGVTSQISQAIGRKDAEGANAIATQAVLLGAMTGLIAGVIGWFGAPHVLYALGARGDVFGQALSYIQTIFFVTPVVFVNVFLRSIFNGEGNSKTPVKLQYIASVLNIILDPIFIFVLGFGVQGAAIGTAISIIVYFGLIGYLVFVKRATNVCVDLTHARPQWNIHRKILRIGAPAAGTNIIMQIGATLINGILTPYGHKTVAAYGVAFRFERLLLVPLFGLALSLITVNGMFYGAGRFDLIRRTIRFSMTRAWMILIPFGVFLFFFGGEFLRLFTSDPEVRDMGQTYYRIMVFMYPLMTIGMCCGATLQGMGQTFTDMLLTTFRVLVIGVPVGYGLIYFFDMPYYSMFIGMVCGSGIAAGIALLILRRKLWTCEQC
jgi:putative MATE family efflux protein